jgi:hypothetical protein
MVKDCVKISNIDKIFWVSAFRVQLPCNVVSPSKRRSWWSHCAVPISDAIRSTWYFTRHDIIPTQFRLFSIHWQSPSDCTYCCVTDSLLHRLRGCTKTYWHMAAGWTEFPSFCTRNSGTSPLHGRYGPHLNTDPCYRCYVTGSIISSIIDGNKLPRLHWFHVHSLLVDQYVEGKGNELW